MLEVNESATIAATLVALVVVAVCSCTVATGEREEIHLGPYVVTFDAGKELQDWNITKSESETYSGVPFTTYEALCFNKYLFISIMWINATPENRVSIEDFQKTIEKDCESKGMYWNSIYPTYPTCETHPRTIDGHGGFVMTVDYPEKVPFFEIFWYNDAYTTIHVTSFLSWEETIPLLRSIHVEAHK